MTLFVYSFLLSHTLRGKNDSVKCYHIAPFRDTMFGLPFITVALVGGAFLLIILALLYWGLTFKEIPA